MKKLIFVLYLLAVCITSIPQEIQHEAVAVNIEVPVRVFKGDTFIDNLTMDDFEIYEDGVLQKVEAVYLIKKTDIVKEEKSAGAIESKKIFTPEVSRHFVLLFEVQDYLPKLGEAIDEFFSSVIAPEDTLTVITPMKTYNFKKEALEILPKKEIASQLKSKLKKDTRLANAEYISLLKRLKANLTNRMEYSMLLNRLETIRSINENKFQRFADFLKEKPGQKNVFLFYQKEILPQLDNKTLMQLMSINMDDISFQFHLQDLLLYKRTVTYDIEKIKRIFADSSISINFLYLTKMPLVAFGADGKPPSPTSWMEQSGDVFSAFKEMADATGGFTYSSANAMASFKRAVSASENYYLLYYTPKDYKSDSKFKNIKVKIKGKKYKVLYRAGYTAD